MSTVEHPLTGHGGAPPPTTRTGAPARGGRSTPPPPPPPEINALAGAGDEVSGVAAFGTLIQVLSDIGPPEMFVSIEGVGDIAGPNIQIAEAETTSHSSGAPIRTFIPTLIDPGEITFPCFWNPSDATQSASSPYGMERLFYDRTITQFRLVNTDETHRTRQFAGYVKSLGETYPLAGICTRNISIRITSPMKDVASPIAMVPAQLTVDSTGIPVSPIEVTTGGNNTPWQATTVDAWIHITAPVGDTVGDGSVTFTLDANSGGVDRTGAIHVAALNLTCSIFQTKLP